MIAMMRLKTLWPTLKFIHRKPRHTQNQDSVESANQDIENKFCTWMKDIKFDSWGEELGFVQFIKNRVYHSRIKKKRTPHYSGKFATKSIKIGRN